MITTGTITTGTITTGQASTDMTATGTDADLHRAIATRLADHDQRYTANRRAVVDVLAGAGAPLTLPDLLAADTSLAQSSVYRSLSVMIDAGVVRRLVHVGDHAHFELAEHLTEHHHHLICETCGIVVDVTLPDPVEVAMDRSFDQVADDYGFTSSHHAVDIYGTCAQCRSASADGHVRDAGKV
jgi:Fur family transcriptional regulator, ferric uptake regulator